MGTALYTSFLQTWMNSNPKASLFMMFSTMRILSTLSSRGCIVPQPLLQVFNSLIVNHLSPALSELSRKHCHSSEEMEQEDLAREHALISKSTSDVLRSCAGMFAFCPMEKVWSTKGCDEI